MRIYRFSALVTLVVFAFGCEPEDERNNVISGIESTDEPESTDEQEPQGGEGSDDPQDPGSIGNGTPDVEGCEAIDILFVVDDSGSMQQEQDNLADNFPKFIEVLEARKR